MVLQYILGYTIVHNLSYSYLIPQPVRDLIKDINKLKDPTLSFKEYLDSVSVEKLDYTIKRNSDYSVPAFRGVYANIFGNIETNPGDIKIEKNDVPEYIIEFEYKITIHYPHSLSIQYPILINNKSLPNKWLPKQRYATFVDRGEGVLNIIEVLKGYLKFKNNDIVMHRIPDYDNFYPNMYDNSYYMRLVSILLQTDETNPNFIFNLDDLKYIGIPPYLVDYLKTTNDKELFTFGQALIYIELYDSNIKKDLGLYKDENNNILSTIPLSKGNSYHIVINLILDKGVINYFRESSRK